MEADHHHHHTPKFLMWTKLLSICMDRRMARTTIDVIALDDQSNMEMGIFLSFFQWMTVSRINPSSFIWEKELSIFLFLIHTQGNEGCPQTNTKLCDQRLGIMEASCPYQAHPPLFDQCLFLIDNSVFWRLSNESIMRFSSKMQSTTRE